MADRRKRKNIDLALPLGLLTGGAVSSIAGLTSLSSEGLKALRDFAVINPDVSTPERAQAFMRDYAGLGHKALHANAWSNLTPTQVIRLTRSLPGNPYPWDSDAVKHYEAFKRGPDDALRARVEEVTGTKLTNKDPSPEQIAVAGIGSVEPFKAYRSFINRVLATRNAAIYGGAAVAATGAGLLLYHLISRNRKRSRKEKPT